MSKTDNKVSMVTLGCAKNLVDTEVLVGGLKSNQYDIIEHPEDSDIVIFLVNHKIFRKNIKYLKKYKTKIIDPFFFFKF